MIIAISDTAARQRSAVLAADGIIPPSRIEYIGSRPGRGGAGQPQAFTIEMTPGQEFGAHYHTVDQYQVILHGEGRIGRREVSTYSVHYTDRYTGYGPLVAGESAMHYMTLRAEADPGPQYMGQPGARERMRPSKRRFLLKCDIPTLGAEELARLEQPRIDTLFPAHDDGVLALAWRLGPSMTALAPDPAQGGGQFLLVMDGELLLDEPLGRHSTIFVHPGDESVAMRAGAAGAQVLLMQFPRGGQAETAPSSPQ
ncbi:hypothetical protein CDO44_19445 [Pigmentiphaga sp. NML080357]|uniref:hypothetical protein n=1 Tax=Pigmentiphaga sp. NML080357 TaxID=2008675 RepID=UPI000B41837E|nr:hypothetical protein [Pigmentiphaga sp. NML080357]OVZ57269.1 hypothetical protein CDO44_19445 [Pigmentiphaga sp. NML080357]